MFPSKLYLPNRYGDKNYLRLFDAFRQDRWIAEYKLILENKLPFQCGVREGKYFIDPSGGPFLTVGDYLGNLEIVRIFPYMENIYIQVRYSSEVM